MSIHATSFGVTDVSLETFFWSSNRLTDINLTILGVCYLVDIHYYYLRVFITMTLGTVLPYRDKRLRLHR